jgi:aminomethyltransferase
VASTPAPAQSLRRTPLFDRHVAAGAKLVPFAGWEMPVQYAGIRQEHRAVRADVGIFDVSHMGEIETSGPEAAALLQRLLSNDVDKIKVGGAQYSVLCREDGGVLDDLFTYRLAADRFLTVTNAANHEKDLAWFQAHARDFDAAVADALDGYAMLAVQGPGARELVQALSDSPLPTRFTIGRRHVAGRRMLVAGTGYTGEDGVELLVDPADAPQVWDALVGRGAVPAGLAARPASTSTATTSWRSGGRSKPASAGAARRTPGSSAPTPSARSARPGPPRSSSRSASTARASRARATSSWPAAATMPWAS